MRINISPVAIRCLSSIASAALLLCSCASSTTASRPQATQGVPAGSLQQQIQDAYARNRQALLSREPSAVLALRTEDFHVITPDGAMHDAAEMTHFTHNLLSNVESWEALSFDVLGLAQEGQEVRVDVRQHSRRKMRRPDGTVQLVENWVIQRETWVQTPQGWKMRKVDNIRDQRVLINGTPRA